MSNLGNKIDRILNNEHWTDRKKISLMSYLVMTIQKEENTGEEDVFLIEVAIENIVEKLKAEAKRAKLLKERKAKVEEIQSILQNSFTWNEGKKQVILSNLEEVMT